MKSSTEQIKDKSYPLLLQCFDPQIRISQTSTDHSRNIKHNKDKSNHHGTIKTFAGRPFVYGLRFGLKLIT